MAFSPSPRGEGVRGRGATWVVALEETFAIPTRCRPLSGGRNNKQAVAHQVEAGGGQGTLGAHGLETHYMYPLLAQMHAAEYR